MKFNIRYAFNFLICFRQKLDLELIPIELQLRAWAKSLGRQSLANACGSGAASLYRLTYGPK